MIACENLPGQRIRKQFARPLTLRGTMRCFCPMKSRSKGKSTTVPTKGTLLSKLGLEGDNPGVFCGQWLGSGKLLKSVSPIDGQVLATLRMATPEQYEQTVRR